MGEMKNVYNEDHGDRSTAAKATAAVNVMANAASNGAAARMTNEGAARRSRVGHHSDMSHGPGGHQLPDLLQRGVGPWLESRQAAVADHGDAVADLEQLFQIL